VTTVAGLQRSIGVCMWWGGGVLCNGRDVEIEIEMREQLDQPPSSLSKIIRQINYYLLSPSTDSQVIGPSDDVE
jgi:hypothetical protein